MVSLLNHGPGRLGTGQVSETGKNPGGKIPWPAVTLTEVIPYSLGNGFQLRSLIAEKKGCVGQLSWNDHHHLFIKMECPQHCAGTGPVVHKKGWALAVPQGNRAWEICVAVLPLCTGPVYMGRKNKTVSCLLLFFLPEFIDFF